MKKIISINESDNYSFSKINNLEANSPFRNRVSEEVVNLKIKEINKEFINLEENDFTDLLKCQLTKQVMKNPVVNEFGNWYEEEAIEKWINEGNQFDPISNKKLKSKILIKCNNLLKLSKKLEKMNFFYINYIRELEEKIKDLSIEIKNLELSIKYMKYSNEKVLFLDNMHIQSEAQSFEEKRSFINLIEEVSNITTFSEICRQQNYCKSLSSKKSMKSCNSSIINLSTDDKLCIDSKQNDELEEKFKQNNLNNRKMPYSNSNEDIINIKENTSKIFEAILSNCSLIVVKYLIKKIVEKSNNYNSNQKFIKDLQDSDIDKTTTQIEFRNLLNSLKNNQEESLLHKAAFSNTNLDVLEFFIEYIDINLKTLDGSTALHFACSNNSLEVIKLLISKGSDISIKNNESLTAFELGLNLNHSEAVKEFINIQTNN